MHRVLLEPPGSLVPPRWAASRPGLTHSLHHGVAVAATLIAGTSTGDVWVLAALLGLSSDASGLLAAGLVAAAVVVRIGSSSLTALAGVQAVLGPAALVGPGPSAASAWLSGTALVAVAPSGAAAFAFGVAAAAIVAGPAPRTEIDWVVRGGAAAVGGGLALARGRFLRGRSPNRSLAALGLISAAAALALAAFR